MSIFYSCHLLLDHIQWTLIHGPNIPGSYAILFFTTSDFTFITSKIHNWVAFPLWLSHFILSGAVSSHPPLFPSSILDIIVWCHIFLPFCTVHGVLMARILEWFAIPSSSGTRFVSTLHYDPSVLGGPALSSGHRIGKGQLSSQFQRRALPKNVETIVQLHSFYIIISSKYFKLGFSSMWTENFQMWWL